MVVFMLLLVNRFSTWWPSVSKCRHSTLSSGTYLLDKLRGLPLLMMAWLLNKDYRSSFTDRNDEDIRICTSSGQIMAGKHNDTETKTTLTLLTNWKHCLRYRDQETLLTQPHHKYIKRASLRTRHRTKSSRGLWLLSILWYWCECLYER